MANSNVIMLIVEFQMAFLFIGLIEILYNELEDTKMNTNRLYDVLKHVALILPLFITFPTPMCEIYGCPYTVQIVATMAAVNTLIAGLVEVMATNYYKKMNDTLTDFTIDEVETDEDDRK